MQIQSGWCVAAAWLLTLGAMEFWAALLHGQLWHGILWPVHRTHHRGRGDVDAPPAQRRPLPKKRWEGNDLLPLVHVPLATGLLYWACSGAASVLSDLLWGIGWGMTSFGVAYLVVHDGVAHGRFLPQAWVSWLRRWRLLRRIRSAHCLHHAHGGAPFGLFTGPWVVAAGRRRSAQRPATAPLGTAQRGAGHAAAPAQQLGGTQAVGHHAI